MRVLLIFVLMAVLCGCDQRKLLLDRIEKIAAGPAPAAGRGAAAKEIVAAFDKGDLAMGDAIDASSLLLESAAKKPADLVLSAHATAYAGAVLDAVAARADKLKQSSEFELFWMKVGRLAFRAAEDAHAQGRLAEARDLVFNGGTRWQTEAYWVRYSDHDALASIILARTGDEPEAIRRLSMRSDLRGLAQEVYEKLTGRKQ